MGWDYINHPKFLRSMYSAEMHFAMPVLLKDVVALLAPERIGLPLIDYEGDPEVYHKIENERHQQVSHQGRRAIAAGAQISFVQLRFISNSWIVKNGVKIDNFEGQLLAGSPERASHYVSRYEPLWCAHKVTEPAMLRDIVLAFQAAVTQAFAPIVFRGQAAVWLRHPAVGHYIEVDLNGSRQSKSGLRPSEKKSWLPEGYDEPVSLSKKEINSPSMQRIIKTLSPETSAKLFALVR